MIKTATWLLFFLSLTGICAAQHDTIIPATPVFDTTVIIAKPTDTISPFMQRATESIRKTIHVLSFTQYRDHKIDKPLQGPEAYEAQRGKKINSISIDILYPFGVDIDHPDDIHPTKVQTFANKIQNKTRTWVIRNELLFKEGDALDPLAFSDTERNLWLKNVYKDIRFDISSRDDNTIDVRIYIRDRWNWSLQSTADFRRISTGPQFSNLFGFPQQIAVEASFNYRLDNPYTVAVTYRYSNIAATHIDAILSGRFDNLQRGGEFAFSRPFFSGKTIWAGRALINYYDQRYTVTSPEGPALLAPNKVNKQDFWMARTFDLTEKVCGDNALYKLITAARMIRVDYTERPFIYGADGTISFLNQTSLLFGVGFAQWDYYVDHNVYSLVQAEYFPKGFSAALIGGFQQDEILQRRTYIGASCQYGHYFRDAGYFITQWKYGGFPAMNSYSQLLIDWRNTFYTINQRLGKASIRQIVNLYGRWGYDRPYGREITIDNFNGLRGLYTNQLRGSSTYALDYEVDFFSPKKIIGFNTSMFLFTDLAIIQRGLKDNTFQSGVGLGFRFRNVNLNIDFIQLMIAYYPALNIANQNPYNLLGSNRNDRLIQSQDLFQPTVLNID